MSFAELLATPGVQEECALRSRFGFLAFHGGDLERMTDHIATEAAERAGASLYAVVQPVGSRRHLPSTSVTPEASAVLRQFLAHVDVVVAVHGYGRQGLWNHLLLGGRNRGLAAHLASHLRAELPGYQVVEEIETLPKDLRGLHPANPVNLPAQAGVQLELPPRVRGLTPYWCNTPRRNGRVPDTDALILALAAAASAPYRQRPFVIRG